MTIGRQFFVFLLVGAFSALVDICLMQYLLLQGARSPMAVAVGFAAGLCVNYLSHSRYTFVSGPSARTMTKFAAVVGFNYLLTLAFVYFGQAVAGSALIGKIASLPVVALVGFFVSRHWVFK